MNEEAKEDQKEHAKYETVKWTVKCKAIKKKKTIHKYNKGT
jgi:hypothetical protein